jgi:MGT family glycosyltransferase
VTTAGQVDAAALPQPPNVVVAEYVSHTAVLGATDVMVTHGGLGSIASALTAGVPLVCTPVSRDQFVNAERVAEVGAGVALPASPSASDVATAVQKVLTDAGYREGARAMAGVSRAQGGAPAAVADLAGLLG